MNALRILFALLLALGVHAILAAALAFLLNLPPVATEAPGLDLSSVELSLAEEEADASPPAVAPPESPAAARAPAIPVAPPPPDSPPDVVAVPPEMAAVALPEPEPERPDMDDPPDEKRDDESAPVEDAERAEEEDDGARPTAGDDPAPPPPAPRQARIDAPPSPKRTIRPKYPEESRRRGEEGDVLVEFEIDESGRVTAARVAGTSGHPALDEAALRAARKARFNPAKSGRAAVPSTARLKLEFRLK